MRVPHGLGRFIGMCLLLAPLFVLAAGCGKGGVVSGKVYYKGKPVTRGTVNFYPEGKGGNYASLIEPDGSYSIAKIPPGPAKITVMVGMSGPPPGLGMRGGPRSADRAAQGMKQMERVAKSEGADSGNAADNASVPTKYTDPDISGLQLNVTGGAQTFDIKLE